MEGGEGEDSEWRRDAYCAPRNSLLCLTAEFYNKCSAKLHEINKRKDQEKQLELLDTRLSVRAFFCTWPNLYFFIENPRVYTGIPRVFFFLKNG